MKRISSIALAFILVFGSCFSVFAAESDQTEAVPSDVEGTVYETAVKNLVDAGILAGYSDGLFHPERAVNRAEACVMVVKAMKPSQADLDASNDSLFDDMDGYSWAVPYVNYAVSRGIVSGYGDNKFQPSNQVTYVEVAAMLVNAMGFTSSDLKGEWPDNYADKARELGLFKVVANSSSLSIKANANRGDVANMLNSVTKEIADADVQPVTRQNEKELDPQLNDGSPQAELIENTKENIVPTMSFVGTPISLSLEDAVKQMQTTGPGYEAAVLNHDATLASALNYGESASSIRMAQKYHIEVDYSKKDQAELARDYLRKSAPIDFQADMNNLESSAVKSYYSVLIAQENYRIEQENLQVQQELLKNTQKKFDQGMVAKIDVISAETAVESAKSSVEASLSTLNLAKMNFNVQLSYPLMQAVNLTDKLEKIDPPTQTLQEAVSSALNNRHELKDAKFNVDLKKLVVEATGIRYPSTSATYKTANLDYLKAQKTYNDAVKQLEMGIRKQYMDLSDDANAIASAQATLANAQEGFRITSLSYDAGLKTLTDVQEMQVKVYQAELLLASKINEYDLNVYALRYATDVGVGTDS